MVVDLGNHPKQALTFLWFAPGTLRGSCSSSRRNLKLYSKNHQSNFTLSKFWGSIEIMLLYDTGRKIHGWLSGAVGGMPTLYRGIVTDIEIGVTASNQCLIRSHHPEDAPDHPSDKWWRDRQVAAKAQALPPGLWEAPRFEWRVEGAESDESYNGRRRIKIMMTTW